MKHLVYLSLIVFLIATTYYNVALPADEEIRSLKEEVSCLEQELQRHQKAANKHFSSCAFVARKKRLSK